MSANTRIAGNFTATGQSSEIVVSARKFVLKIGGTFTATVALETFNTQANAWQAVQAAFTAPVVLVYESGANGQRFRLNCTAYTSGTAGYEIEAPNDI